MSARVSAPLLDAFRNYLGGRYAQAAMINVDAFDERERPQALLVRAAARYLQAELAGDAAQLDAARADARALRALALALKPDPVLFSASAASSTARTDAPPCGTRPKGVCARGQRVGAQRAWQRRPASEPRCRRHHAAVTPPHCRCNGYRRMFRVC